MLAHFVFVNNRILRARVAFGTLSRCAHELRFWLFSLNSRACAVNQKCRQHEREGNRDSDKNRAERHAGSLAGNSLAQAKAFATCKKVWCGKNMKNLVILRLWMPEYGSLGHVVLTATFDTEKSCGKLRSEEHT